MKKLSILTGKAIQKLSRLHGGGSALPGLVIEKTDPRFLGQVLSSLPLGVAVVSGTNGKTTTTKIVTELLEKQGLRVFTNKTGSNFIRGVLSAVLEEIKPDGTFDYDIAVLELDEAHAVHFAETIPINYALILNVQRDQLDRFCELDHTAALLEKTTLAAQKISVLNREDPLVRNLRTSNAVYYGLSKELQKLFPSDDDLLSGEASSYDNLKAGDRLPADVVLYSLQDHHAVYHMEDREYSCDLSLDGIFNAFNAAGALALCRQILKDMTMVSTPGSPDQTPARTGAADPEALIRDLSSVRSAFGRSEEIRYKDTSVQLILVKNPAAFQLSLASFLEDDCSYMIVINDHDADGRDMSWLWNVDFSALPGVHTLSGTRAPEMALRLKYDQVPFEHVEEDLSRALDIFLPSPGHKRIFATYTAMLELRKLLTGRSLI